ncbi:hypothetical protein [Spiroplasma alleghenense]|uniref:Uncharacterized protein n=1 Tax=Spiroplasma alleghenense TaxID=216931 RepID=A0A345Z5D2_9MOLU|nr:hypothetical protein [Spiroplasma alleghenense]AXK51811.1 hypothetical protein SALLE_v1c11410 [Spiroplasma alleghenense]
MKNKLTKLLLTLTPLTFAPFLKGSLQVSHFSNIKEEVLDKSTFFDKENLINFNGKKFSSKDSFDSYLLGNNFLNKKEGSNLTNYSKEEKINISDLEFSGNWADQFKQLYLTASNGYLSDYSEAMKTYLDGIRWEDNFSYDNKNWSPNIEEAKKDFFERNVTTYDTFFYKYNNRYFNANLVEDILKLKSLGQDGYIVFKEPSIDLEKEYIYGTKESLKKDIKEALKKHFWDLNPEKDYHGEYKGLSARGSTKKLKYYKLEIIPPKDQRIDFFYDEDGGYDRFEGGQTASLILNNLEDVEFLKNPNNWNHHAFPAINKNESYSETNIRDFNGKKYRIVYKTTKMKIYHGGYSEFRLPDFDKTEFKVTEKEGAGFYLYGDDKDDAPIKKFEKNMWETLSKYSELAYNKAFRKPLEKKFSYEFDKIFDSYYEHHTFGNKIKMLEKDNIKNHDLNSIDNYFPLVDKYDVNIREVLEIFEGKLLFENSESKFLELFASFIFNLLIRDGIKWEDIKEPDWFKKIKLNQKYSDLSDEDILLINEKAAKEVLDNLVQKSKRPVFDFIEPMNFKHYFSWIDNIFLSDPKGEKITDSIWDLKDKYFDYYQKRPINFQSKDEIFGYKNLVKETDEDLIDRLEFYLKPQFGYHNIKNLNSPTIEGRDYYNPPAYTEEPGYAYGFTSSNGEEIYFNNIDEALKKLKEDLFASDKYSVETIYKRVYFYQENGETKSFVFSSEKEVDDWIQKNHYKLKN